MIQILGALISPIASIIGNWQKKKLQKQESEFKIEEAKTDAKIRILETSQDAEIDWNLKALDQSGWKDEWFTILLSIPAIMCFIPGLDIYVINGFTALKETPEWYRVCFLVAVAASFGYRKLVDMFGTTKKK